MELDLDIGLASTSTLRRGLEVRIPAIPDSCDSRSS